MLRSLWRSCSRSILSRPITDLVVEVDNVDHKASQDVDVQTSVLYRQDNLGQLAKFPGERGQRRRKRASRPWLFREARRKRSTAWRGTWRIIAVALLAVVVCCTFYGIIWWRHQFEVGLLVGCLGTLLVGSSVFVFWIAEGSLVARLARLHEQWACNLIEGAEGVYAVVRNVEFDDFDVDCAVMAPAGVFAFEVKSLLAVRPAKQLIPTLEAHYGDQARHAARKIRLLLKSKGLQIDVKPAVILIGPGVPESLPSYRKDADGVRWVTVRNCQDWLPRLENGELGADCADLCETALQHYVVAFRPDE